MTIAYAFLSYLDKMDALALSWTSHGAEVHNEWSAPFSLRTAAHLLWRREASGLEGTKLLSL